MIPLALLLLVQQAPGERVLPSITGLDKPCPKDNDEEIVVCARRSDSERQRFREPALPPGYQPDTTPGSFRIGENQELGAEVGSTQRPDGTVNKYIMIKLKTRF